MHENTSESPDAVVLESIYVNLIRPRVEEMLLEVIKLYGTVAGARNSTRALGYFLTRGYFSWRSLNILCDWAAVPGNQWRFVAHDSVGILRCLMDGHVQAAYLFHDPNEREVRAKLYLEFEHVERFDQANAVIGRDNQVSRWIADSPMRPEGEKRIIAEFDRVKVNYPRRVRNAGKLTKPIKVRDKWYEGTLRELARVIGWEDEYIIYVKRFNGSIHAGPWAIQCGPPMTPSQHCLLAATLVGRLSGFMVENERMCVSAAVRESIDHLAKADPIGKLNATPPP